MELTAVACVAATASSQVMPGAVVVLTAADGSVFFSDITDHDGYLVFLRVPIPFAGKLKLAGAVQFYEADVTITGHNVTLRVGDTPSNPQDVLLPPCVPVPSFKVAPISKDQFRAMTLKGDFGNMVLPGLGLSIHGTLFDPMIPWYPESTQEMIFAEKKARGLNVIQLCSWSDYHGGEFGMPVRYDWISADDGPQQARAYCVKLRRLGFIPAFWLLGDRMPGDAYDPNGGNCDQALALIRRMLPAIQDVIGCASPGFELRGCCGASGAPYSAAQYWRMLIEMNAIAPTLYKFGHFVSENSAGSSHSPGEAGDPWHEDEIFFWTGSSWPEGSTLLDGCFYQAPTDDKLFGPTEEWRDRWQEMIERIGRDNRRWPPACTAVDLAWGESGWYNVTRGDNTEAQAVAVANVAMEMGGRWSFSG